MALNVTAVDFSTGISSFAFDLYQKSADESINENLILSPFSVAIALALLSQIAQNNTFTQIVRGLHLGNDKSSIAADFARNYDLLTERVGQSTLNIANQLYVQQGYEIQKSFRDVAVNQFKSGIDLVNFAERVQTAATINSFVERETNDKIKNLIKPGSLSSDTRLVIVNAIYFKGEWQKKFLKYRTASENFFTDETNTVPIDFMRDNEGYNYAELDDLDAKAVELKYKRSNISFVIVLPNSRSGLSGLEASLHTYDMKKITSKLHGAYVEVIIPKFKFEYEIELNDVLQKLGMVDLFGDNSDLSGLSESGENLKVSKAIHKAFIEVDENGTEAAAATGIIAVPTSLKIWKTEKKIFRADHPFLFYILDVEQNTIIFSGRFLK